MTTEIQPPALEVERALPVGSRVGPVRLVVDNTAVHVASLTAFIACFYSTAVPEGNELVYLPAAFRQWHPDFLLNDWTFSHEFTTHIVFNHLAGLPMLVAPLEAVGWVGRLVCWTLLAFGLLRLGRRFGIPLPLVSLSVALWIAIGQSIVGGEWMLRGLEAKVVAYVFLLFAIDRLLDDRDISGAILLGLCISLHAAVGVVAAFAVGIGFLALRYPWPRIARIVGWTSLLALPGVLPVLLAGGPGAYGTGEAWRFLSLVAMPFHFDPASFPKRDLLLLGLLLGFNALYWYVDRSDRMLRFSIAFQAGLAAVFGFGVLCRIAGRYEMLQVTPFRLLPLFAPLLFFFSWFGMAWKQRTSRRMGAVVVTGTLALLAFQDPIDQVWDRAAWLLASRAERRDDLGAALGWLREHTPNGSIAIVPPWRKDSFYLSRRAQIAMWQFPQYEDVAGWRSRIEALVGPLDVETLAVGTDEQRVAAVGEQMAEGYRERTEAQIAAIVERYGGDYLVSDASYSYPVLFDTGSYKVYRLTPPETAPPLATGRSRPGS